MLKPATSKETSKLNWAGLKTGSVKNVKTPPRYWTRSGAGLCLRALAQKVARLQPNSVDQWEESLLRQRANGIPQRYARLGCSVRPLADVSDSPPGGTDTRS